MPVPSGSIQDRLDGLASEFSSEFSKALKGAQVEGSSGAAVGDGLHALKNRYLGRKGVFASLLKELSSLAPEEKRDAGKAINILKNKVEGEINDAIAALEKSEKDARLATERLDVTLPGRGTRPGHTHPITKVLEEVDEIFASLGFSVEEGPEIETDYYNFEALNFPKDHPAREMQDTFFISPGQTDGSSSDLCLRTHTSPVQIRVMEAEKPPLMVIAPGTVYRRDSDLTHTPMFHQVEGFMVDEGINFAHLKGVLTHFLHRLFGEEKAVRFRPSFFPFTEPSAEVDIECAVCKGNGTGCRVCKESGWLEILGCGMIHPNVLAGVNYDTEKYTGFAFGMGIERIAMLKYGIDDIRLFFENDVRFLRQF